MIKIRKTDSNYKKLINKFVLVLWNDDCGYWSDYHYIRKVNKKTILMDNGSENTKFKANKKNIVEIFANDEQLFK